jgi:hypothetical protein
MEISQKRRAQTNLGAVAFEGEGGGEGAAAFAGIKLTIRKLSNKYSKES